MKKNTLISISLVCLITTSGYATDIPAGPVSGDWYSSGNPYNINGEIYVHEDSTLNIHEGVDVIFQGHHKFIVNGFLEAIGTETDSILFTAADTSEGWHSLRFIDAPDSSHLSYCIIQYGRATGSTFEDSLGGGIYGDHSSPVIDHCTIRWNSTVYNGGGCVFFNDSDPTIKYSNIIGNMSEGYVGGMHFDYDCDPIVSHCTISENASLWVGGIYFGHNSNPDMDYSTISGNTGIGVGFMYDCNVTISHCIISENSTTQYGGGISYGYDCIMTIDHSIISGNSAVPGAGGISIGMNSEAYISNCTVSNNHSQFFGGGIGCMIGVDVEIKNTIVEGNTGSGGIYFDNSAEAEVNYSDFHDNEPSDFTGDNIPPNLGVIANTNANGDSCDQYHNIFLNPLYHSTTGDSAFFLTEESPCINAGDPFTPPDPDGTTADIGAYWSGYVGVSDECPLNSPLEYVLHDVYPNPFNPSTNLTFSLPISGNVSLIIFDIQGREVVKLIEGFHLPGLYQVTFDASGLSSGLYFARLKAGNFSQTQKLLFIR